MCLIIDANCASKIESPDAKPLIDWLISPKTEGKLVLGGKLAEELGRVRLIQRLLLRLSQAGRLMVIKEEHIVEEERYILKNCACRSNDVHVLALARAGGARLLFSNDENLHADFKDASIVPSPKGRVYQNADHRKLLGRKDLCRLRRTSM